MTAPKERPIIFSTESIKRILAGEKTQTRRVMKPQPINQGHCFDWSPARSKDKFLWAADHQPGLIQLACPAGKPGDHLWVRESWWYRERDGMMCFNDPPAIRAHHTSLAAQMGIDGPYELPDRLTPEQMAAASWVKKSPIFMPRWASRITLEIVKVRVERLKEISYQDILAEGIVPDFTWPVERECREHAVKYFASRWDGINGKKFPWQSNPWVWVISFKKLEPVCGNCKGYGLTDRDTGTPVNPATSVFMDAVHCSECSLEDV